MGDVEAGYDELLEVAHDELARLVRRLHSLSAHAWASRRDAVVADLRRLAELDGLAEARVVPGLPELANFALADATAVIGTDVLAALSTVRNVDLLAAVLVELRATLDATR